MENNKSVIKNLTELCKIKNKNIREHNKKIEELKAKKKVNLNGVIE